MKNQKQRNNDWVWIYLLLISLMVIALLISYLDDPIEYEGECDFSGITLNITEDNFEGFTLTPESNINCKFKGKLPYWALR